MKTIYYLILTLFLFACSKQTEFPEQTLPEIGVEHNKILTVLVDEIHKYPMEE